MIAVIDIGANVGSIFFALRRLNMEGKLTTNLIDIKKATHIILPGVGSACNAMRKLRELNLCDPLSVLDQPVLGICLGMQLCYESSEEGNVICLGVTPGKIKKISENLNVTIPHLGWNRVTAQEDSLLWKNISEQSYLYFMHSYFAPITQDTTSTVNNGFTFSASFQRNNYFGVQFHPERSGTVGSQILKNFLEL